MDRQLGTGGREVLGDIGAPGRSQEPRVLDLRGEHRLQPAAAYEQARPGLVPRARRWSVLCRLPAAGTSQCLLREV